MIPEKINKILDKYQWADIAIRVTSYCILIFAALLIICLGTEIIIEDTIQTVPKIHCDKIGFYNNRTECWTYQPPMLKESIVTIKRICDNKTEEIVTFKLDVGKSFVFPYDEGCKWIEANTTDYYYPSKYIHPQTEPKSKTGLLIVLALVLVGVVVGFFMWKQKQDY